MSEEVKEPQVDNSETAQPSIEKQTAEPGNSSDIAIPEKFLKSSKMDLIKAYQELEKDRGRLASEVGELRKVKESYDERVQKLEQLAQQINLQPQPMAQQQASKPDVDPFSVIDQKFDEDPVGAVKEALKRQQELLLKQTQSLSAKQQAALAAEWHEKQKQENPDYRRREAVMLNLAKEYGDLFSPDASQSVKTLRLLDLASKGADIEYYQKQALKQSVSNIKEKRAAQTESSAAGSTGGDQVDLSKLSHEEYLKAIEELYGHAD